MCVDDAVLTSTHNLGFEQEYKEYQNFLSKNFPFLVVKFSIFLNRRVFVMANSLSTLPGMPKTEIGLLQRKVWERAFSLKWVNCSLPFSRSD